MIIFTITNKVTGQVYVGSTRNDLECQWAKIQAATEQGLDFPLYRAIRTHGEDAFDVEEWDRAEDRQELLELEEEAIERLGAISLRGHKTSTVVIRPKKKVRKRKSAADKEAAFLLAQIQSDDSDPDELPASSLSLPETEEKPAEKQGQVIKKSQEVTASKPATQTATRSSTATGTRIPAAAEKPAAPKQPEVKETIAAEAAQSKPQGSTSSARIQMPELALDNDISSQLAAIQAAADAVLAGNSDAANTLGTLENTPEEPVVVAQQPEPEPEPEVIDERQLRIMEAVKRHRQKMAQHTSEKDKEARNKLATLLAAMNKRAEEMTIAANNATEPSLSLITANAA